MGRLEDWKDRVGWMTPPEPEEQPMVKLGDRVRDAITGFEGIATAKHEYLNGCVRYSVEAPDKDGKPDEYAFDDQQLTVIEDGAYTPKDTPRMATGGPPGHKTPPRR